MTVRIRRVFLLFLFFALFPENTFFLLVYKLWRTPYMHYFLYKLYSCTGPR